MDPHDNFFHSLTAEEEHLLIIRDFLYNGDWADVIKDLHSRKSGKPFVFKLNTRIDDDLIRIKRLRDYEKVHEVNLGYYLINSGKFPELTGVLVQSAYSGDAYSGDASTGDVHSGSTHSGNAHSGNEESYSEGTSASIEDSKEKQS